tara:strand:+ start:61695 stop:62006 length:312 start_codon:yes stop_codon:yes gene_type:complete
MSSMTYLEEHRAFLADQDRKLAEAVKEKLSEISQNHSECFPDDYYDKGEYLEMMFKIQLFTSDIYENFTAWPFGESMSSEYGWHDSSHEAIMTTFLLMDLTKH